MEEVCKAKHIFSSMLDSDLNDFEKRLKQSEPFFEGSSDEEEEETKKPRFATEADVLKEKNRILMDKLFKADKQTAELREAVEAVSGKAADLKDKKIVELLKKNRALQLQVESLKTKAAKAAEIAIKIKKEAEAEPPVEQPKKGGLESSLGGSSMMTLESEKRSKELEKKVTKLRNEK